jgi:hypothetical protein
LVDKVSDEELHDEQDHFCTFCAGSIVESEMIFYVESTLRRKFCSKDCISQFFQPFVEELIGELNHFRSDDDIEEADYAEYRDLFESTIAEPHQVYKEPDGTGFDRYILISEFDVYSHKVWFVVVCTILHGQPSFVFIGFPTKDPELTNRYRRGETVDWEALLVEEQELMEQEPDLSNVMDFQASQEEAEELRKYEELLDNPEREEFIEDLQENMIKNRDENDVPFDEFEFYAHLEKETLSEPDEVYSWASSDGKKLLTYIATFGAIEGDLEKNKEVNAPEYSWGTPVSEALTYVVICELIGEGDFDPKDPKNNVAIPLISFPTLSVNLANEYRKGSRLDLGDPIH